MNTPTAATTFDITTQQGNANQVDLLNLATWITCYARDGMDWQTRQLRRADGDRYPGSTARWISKAPEREAYAEMISQKKAWALYRLVHGEPCASELRRLAYEAETKAEHQRLARAAGLEVKS